jgi:predicted dehydrogenase
MSERLKVGIIGFGKMGRVRKTAIEECSHLSLVSICDSAIPADSSLARYHLARDYRELLETNLGAVFVCTPNAVTAEVVVAALERGKHVFSEKPPGRNLEEVRRILEAEAANPRLKLKFGFNHRYHGSVREALGIVRSGSLGRLLWMRGVYGKSGADGFEQEWRSKRELAGGGILLDQGIHMVDLFRLFGGEFDEVKSFVTNSYWQIDVEDNAFALLRNRQNIVAMLHSSSTQWKHLFSLELFLAEGYIAINGLLSSTRSYGRETLQVAERQATSGRMVGDPREEITYFDQDFSFTREVEEFAECVLRDRKVEVGTSEDALKAMELVYRIYAGDPIWWERVSGRGERRPVE